MAWSCFRGQSIVGRRGKISDELKFPLLAPTPSSTSSLRRPGGSWLRPIWGRLLHDCSSPVMVDAPGVKCDHEQWGLKLCSCLLLSALCFTPCELHAQI